MLYKHPAEKNFLTYYAEKMRRTDILKILNAECVKNSEEAKVLALFFWQMTDQIVKDKRQGIKLKGFEDLEAWNEYTLDSIRAYLINSGYENEWNLYD